MTDASAATPSTAVEGVALVDLPKVSLHDHLDGGLRPGTIIELGAEAGVAVPESDPEALGAWFRAQSDSGSLVEYLKTFDLTIAVMQTEEGLRRVAREFVEDLHADGVLYGELRWAPEQHVQQGLSTDAAVEAVQAGIDEAVASVEANGGWIRAGQLVSAMRHLDNGVEIAELALRHRDDGVHGFDIAGPEDGFPPSRMKDAFDLLLSEGLPITVHAGEAAGLASIRSALIDGHALRLGHGVRIREDIEIVSDDGEAVGVRLGRLAQWVRDRRMPLEVSPSSNLQTGAFAAWGSDFDDHPFDTLYQLGFAVTVNTDNRLMSGTSLTRELGLLSDAFGYDLDDLLTFQLNAAEGAFLPLEDRVELQARIEEGFGLD
ncbi:adenosine deaminase [Schumannella luteola]|uniref:adenosine deaminase n=1 Tax=Schumannella luteola TaxID=472059 RepID=A0A852Y8G6_9MICO|nr:adenosine deaminase [Schumannella luteola]NYG98693.1 adenosine deaminase [Schumannella luteola]TPX04280.1 adenosine deaminase [Schumannella luteola]